MRGNELLEKAPKNAQFYFGKSRKKSHIFYFLKSENKKYVIFFDFFFDKFWDIFVNFFGIFFDKKKDLSGTNFLQNHQTKLANALYSSAKSPKYRKIKKTRNNLEKVLRCGKIITIRHTEIKIVPVIIILLGAIRDS